jgi:hypothetical protein
MIDSSGSEFRNAEVRTESGRALRCSRLHLRVFGDVIGDGQMPQDLKIEVDRLSRDEASTVARYLAGSAWAPNGRRHAAGLGRRVDTQSIQNPGRALLALVKRRRVDRFPRGRLPRSLPAARHGLAVTGRLLGQRVNLRFLGALAPMSRVVDGMVRHGPYGGTRVL